MTVFKSIAHYFSSYREYIGYRLYIVFFLTAAVAFAEGLGITLLLPLIEAANTGGDGTQELSTAATVLKNFLSVIGIGDSVIGILLFIGVVFFGKALLMFADSGYKSYLSAQLFREIKGKIFSKYSTMNYKYYSDRNTGHFVNIISTQVDHFINSFRYFMMFLTAIILTLSYFAIAFLLAWRFALMAVLLGGILLYLFKRLNRFVRSLSKKTAKESGNLNNFIVQSLQSFKYLASTFQMSHLEKGVVNSIKKLSNYRLKTGLANAFTNSLKELVSVIFLLFVVIVQVAFFNEPIAPIFVALLLFHRGMQQIIGLQMHWQNTMDKIGSLEMVVEEFESVEKAQEINGTNKIPDFQSRILFQNVSYSYNSNEGNVLENIDLEIPLNKTVAFVGESGAGKSTLVDMITLMLPPKSGHIYIDNIDSKEIDLGSWRSQLGYVSQETVVFDDSIANNINLWKGDYQNDPEEQKRVHEAAEKAYAYRFIDELPDGFNTMVGDRGVRLSGGQRQRLFIARELYKNPNLLILDEATSALDSESESFIQKSIDHLKGKTTVIIIAHRLSTIKNADLIYVLDNGRIIEQGSYDELALANNGRFKEMVEIQKL